MGADKGSGVFIIKDSRPLIRPDDLTSRRGIGEPKQFTGVKTSAHHPSREGGNKALGSAGSVWPESRGTRQECVPSAIHLKDLIGY